MTKGFRLNRVPVGADPLNYKPGFRARQLERAAKAAQQTPEQTARLKALEQSFIAKAGWKDPLPENAATRKMRDRDARVTVEGDTDLNHDNVEAAE